MRTVMRGTIASSRMLHNCLRLNMSFMGARISFDDEDVAQDEGRFSCEVDVPTSCSSSFFPGQSISLTIENGIPQGGGSSSTPPARLEPAGNPVAAPRRDDEEMSTLLALHGMGGISTTSLMDRLGINYDQEVERIRYEAAVRANEAPSPSALPGGTNLGVIPPGESSTGQGYSMGWSGAPGVSGRAGVAGPVGISGLRGIQGFSGVSGTVVLGPQGVAPASPQQLPTPEPDPPAPQGSRWEEI